MRTPKEFSQYRYLEGAELTSSFVATVGDALSLADYATTGGLIITARKKLLEKKIAKLRENRRGKRQETLLSFYEKEMEVLDRERLENKELQRKESIGLEQVETGNSRLEAQIQQITKK